MENKAKNFKDEKVWIESQELALEIYKITQEYPKEEKKGIAMELRKTSISLTSNIAKGLSTYLYKEKVNYLNLSQDYLVDIQNLLIISFNLQYLSKYELEKLDEIIINVEKLLNVLINSEK